MTNILRSDKVITRKPHHCWGCTVEYPTGTKMEYSVNKDGGQFYGVYWCETCQSFMDKLDSFVLQDGFDYGELAEIRKYY